ncbi:MAG TPA: hypothetical protein DCL73_06110 [Treponema sp.]|nr:hypothetical protein [Treponema sp.]
MGRRQGDDSRRKSVGFDGLAVYDIEIQNALHEGFFKRLVLYWAQLYADQPEAGWKYGELRPCTVIALLHERIYTEDDIAAL